MHRLRSSSLLTGTGVYLLANILNAAIPFALLPVLTRYLSPADYGRVAMFQALLTALASLSALGVTGAIARKAYDDPKDRHELRDLIASCFQLLLTTSALLFAAVLIFRRELASWLSLDVVWIQGAVFVSATMVVIRIRLGQWQVRKQSRAFGIFQVSQSLGNVSLSLLLVVALHQGYHGRIAAQVGIAAVFATAALVLLHREQLLAIWIWRPELMREALAFGVPLLPHIAGGFLLGTMDRLIVNNELGVAETGIYVVAAQLAGGMALVFDGINKAYWPWLFERLKKDDIEEKRRVVRLTYAWYAVILVTVALVFLVGPTLLTWIAGDRYARAGEIIGWLALGEAFGGMYLMVTNYIFYARRTGLVSLASIASGAANVVLLIAFIRWFGLHGAAWAYCSAMGIRFLLTWWAAHRSVPMPWFGSKAM